MPTRIVYGEKFDLFYTDRRSSSLAGHIFVPTAGLYRDVPIYWRRIPSDPALIAISTISVEHQQLGTELHSAVPSWISSLGDSEMWASCAPIPAEALNRIGWSLSFHWRNAENPAWVNLDFVYWRLARSYFERSAAMGYWAAKNNLRVIYRDGLGVEPDLNTAFQFFEAAAQALVPAPLRHLAACYRFGYGVSLDSEHAAYLEELASVVENPDEIPEN